MPQPFEAVDPGTWSALNASGADEEIARIAPSGGASQAERYTEVDPPPEQIVADAEAAQAQPPQPRPVPQGPPPVRVPQAYAPHGGLYYPPEAEHLSNVETARLRGELTDPQAARAIAGREQWAQTPEGLATDIARDQLGTQAEQSDLAQASLGAHADAARERADYYARAREREAQVAQQAQARRQRLMQDYEAQMDQYRSAVEQAKSAKIDPQRYWKNQGTGMRILAAIAMGLGAVGETVGIKNHAAENIARAVDADIASQQANIDNQRSALGDQQGILAFMRDRIEDSDQAEQAARAQIYANLASYVEQQAAQTESALYKNKAAALAAQFRGQEQIHEKQLKLGAANLARQIAAQRAAAAAAAAQAQAEQRRKMEQLRGWQPLDDKQARYVIPGYGIAAPVSGESAIQKLRDEAAQYKSFEENTERMLQLAKGGITKGTEEYREYKQLYAAVTNPEIKRLMGNATQEELERATPMFGGSPDEFLARNWYNQSKGVERWREIAMRDFKHKLNAYGVQGDVALVPNVDTGKHEWMARHVRPPSGAGAAQLYDSPR